MLIKNTVVHNSKNKLVHKIHRPLLEDPSTLEVYDLLIIKLFLSSQSPGGRATWRFMIQGALSEENLATADEGTIISFILDDFYG